jgi:hypothetical protein
MSLAAARSETLPGNRLRAGFTGLCDNLLSAVADVFPECEQTAHTLRLFGALVQGDADMEDKLIRKCQKAFKAQGDGIRKKEPEALFAVCEGVDALNGIDLRSKWEDEDFTPESKENLWAYVLSLQTYSELYTCVPGTAMEKIESLAARVGGQINEGGEIDFGRLDLNAFGKEIVGSMTPEEIEQLETNLPDITACVGNVASLLGAGGDTGAGGLDVGGLLSKIVELQKGSGGGESNALPDLGPLLAAAIGGKEGASKIDPAELMSMAQKLAAVAGGAPQAGQLPALTANPHGDFAGFDIGALVKSISQAAEGSSAARAPGAQSDLFACPTGDGGTARSETKRRKKA